MFKLTENDYDALSCGVQIRILFHVAGCEFYDRVADMSSRLKFVSGVSYNNWLISLRGILQLNLICRITVALFLNFVI